MAEPVMVILRFAGAVEEVLPRWEQAVKLWQEQFGSEYRLPATVVAEGENGELVVVNVFATDQDHLNFGQNMGGPMAAVGLTEPFAAWSISRCEGSTGTTQGSVDLTSLCGRRVSGLGSTPGAS